MATSSFLPPLQWTTLGAVLAAVIVYLVADAVYNIFFSPLRKYPGPFLCSFSRLPFAYKEYAGRPHLWNHKLHLQYGPVVRYAPNRLSYIDEKAWKDIHGHKKPLPTKDRTMYGTTENGSQNLILSDDESHARMRRIFSHAFSDKALREQESLFKKYIDMLVGNLRKVAKDSSGAALDMVREFNFTAFDIMGDLTFGESLGLLENSEYTPWSTMIADSMRPAMFIRLLRMISVVDQLLLIWLPPVLTKKRDEHFQFSVDRVNKRLAAKVERPDIWGLVLRQQEQGRGLTLGEMHTNASLFMAAGTETTATELSGLLYFLTTNPDKMAKLVHEIRTAFPTEADMSMDDIARLPYLSGCVEEGLRLYPPVPIGLARIIPPGGAEVCGDILPAGTKVSVTQYSTYRSPLNFASPEEFIPERWIDAKYATDKKSALQPFSFGPRNCIGKNMALHEIRLILSSLIWNFDFELQDESKGWVENQRVHFLWEKTPLMLKLTPVKR